MSPNDLPTHERVARGLYFLADGHIRFHEGETTEDDMLTTFEQAVTAAEKGLMALSALVCGLGMGVWGLARLTYLAEAVPLERRGRVIASVAGVYRLGMLIGPALTGFIADQDANVVVIKGADGQSVSLARDDIEDMRVNRLSLMPAGQLKALTDQQIRDLFAYLRATQPLPE